MSGWQRSRGQHRLTQWNGRECVASSHRRLVTGSAAMHKAVFWTLLFLFLSNISMASMRSSNIWRTKTQRGEMKQVLRDIVRLLFHVLQGTSRNYKGPNIHRIVRHLQMLMPYMLGGSVLSPYYYISLPSMPFWVLCLGPKRCQRIFGLADLAGPWERSKSSRRSPCIPSESVS